MISSHTKEWLVNKLVKEAKSAAIKEADRDYRKINRIDEIALNRLASQLVKLQINVMRGKTKC